MDIRSCLKASLLALSLLSMATWLPHMYSCLRTFLLVSLPSVASAVAAPKCLFVFSNIIVVFLVSESKLSHGGSESLSTGEDVAAATGDMPYKRQEEEEEVQVQEEAAMDALAPMITGESKQEEERNVVAVEEEDTFQEGVDMDQGEEAVEEAGGVWLTLEEEAGGEGEVEEEEDMAGALPPADELNRRVEDFIARFNVERQLEARMLVCCC